GVGLAGVQLTRAWGATPFGTARTADKIERAREYGLANGATISGDPEAMLTQTEKWTDGKGINVTLDLVGGPYPGASIQASAPRARIMCIGTVAGRSATVPVGMILGKRLTLRGTVMRARGLEEKRAVTAAFAREVVPLFESGALRPTVDTVLDLAE